VGLKAGFTPAVTFASTFQAPPSVVRERRGFRGGAIRKAFLLALGARHLSSPAL
jgi:hypothetical protein